MTIEEKIKQIKEQENKISTFIEANKLTFEIGRRNSDSVVLSGYALYIGIDNYEDLADILETLDITDYDILTELEEVFSYADDKCYDEWWEHKKAHTMYKF